ncbi:MULTISPECIES: DinB family protein [Peribacillus]|uniref:DinB family protein n=1 Tax=Peribacillus TaxID=2675229 RepID=UPI001F4E8EE9|nr:MULTISPECIES: DinB family protein [unclassified Peribacillus]MCK1981476.1 DinB family protein [Peribacillus sp. Aquil_B1]MCK2006777.1 DinB family protein [Peribacillus sp. Aquil_B8]
MKNVIDGINHWIGFIPNEFNQMTEKELNHRPTPHKWSKKEILGHLCDSALNNMNRFIKIQYEEQPYVIQTYNQEQWVLVQNYQERPMDEIVNLFCSLNKQIIHIITNTPNDRLSILCDIGNNQLQSLEWLIKDYLEHMEHHINNQILNKK